MSKKSIALEKGRKLYEKIIATPESAPVSFFYGDRYHTGLGDYTLVNKEITETKKGEKAVFRYKMDDALEAVFIVEYCAEFGQVEYTLWFENNSDKNSQLIRDMYSIDTEFYGEDPILRGCLGDHDNFYEGYEHDLNKNCKYFKSDNGRATHIVFPYFDLVHGDGGTLFALGWAGTWDAMFSTHEGRTTVRARTCLNLHGTILPGEKIRTGLVVLLPYNGRNADDATNLWREWYMKYNLPKADAEGNPLKPFSTAGFANDTGKPNSDGSISEDHTTWKPTLDRLIKEDVVADFRWFDAGWYFDPYMQTVPADWWGTIGTWELDTVKWPDGSFRESNEACHAVGMKVLTWFEPERVTHIEALAKNYGFNPEWVAPLGGATCANNLGNDECLKWTLDRIIKMMDENAIDMYREDNNSDPVGSWCAWDQYEEQRYGVPRWGINENKSIQGHYKLWDGIIEYCRNNGKCTFVDSCASGGGRNDIESMRRGFPLMRSDYDRTTSAMRLSQTSTFCKWVPYHGSLVKETVGQLDASSGSGVTTYVNRASLLPIYNHCEGYNQNKEFDFDILRRNINEWKSVNHLLTKDFYCLTPWHHHLDSYGWTAIAYDDSEIGESLLLAFRMEQCWKDNSFTAKLPFAEEGATYNIVNEDTKETFTMTGKELKDGALKVVLDEPKSSAMFRIKRV